MHMQINLYIPSSTYYPPPPSSAKINVEGYYIYSIRPPSTARLLPVLEMTTAGKWQIENSRFWHSSLDRQLCLSIVTSKIIHVKKAFHPWNIFNVIWTEPGVAGYNAEAVRSSCSLGHLSREVWTCARKLIYWSSPHKCFYLCVKFLRFVSTVKFF